MQFVGIVGRLLCMFSEGKREAEGETVPTATRVAQIGRGVNGCWAGMIGPKARPGRASQSNRAFWVGREKVKLIPEAGVS